MSAGGHLCPVPGLDRIPLARLCPAVLRRGSPGSASVVPLLHFVPRTGTRGLVQRTGER